MSTVLSKPLNTAFERGVTAPARERTSSLVTVWSVLKFTFGIVPIVAGADKFANFLVHWEIYLNPVIARLVPVSPRILMSAVGAIEIIAGILVLTRPRTGAFIVAAWLAAIALSLIASGHYLDVAVRDLVMAIGAWSLATLSAAVEDRRGR